MQKLKSTLGILTTSGTVDSIYTSFILYFKINERSGFQIKRCWNHLLFLCPEHLVTDTDWNNFSVTSSPLSAGTIPWEFYDKWKK